MISVIVGIAFYLAAALIDVVRRTTTWLPGNVNDGRLDNVYWVLVVGGVFNFGYYVTCAWFYKYQNMKGMLIILLMRDPNACSYPQSNDYEFANNIMSYYSKQKYPKFVKSFWFSVLACFQ